MRRLSRENLISALAGLGITGVGIATALEGTALVANPLAPLVPATMIVGGTLVGVSVLVDKIERKGHKVHKVEKIGKNKFKVHIKPRKTKTAKKSKAVDRKRLRKLM